MCNHGNMRYDQVVMKLRLHHLFLQRGSKSMGLLDMGLLSLGFPSYLYFLEQKNSRP